VNCPTCGQALDETSRFCKFCGAPIDDPEDLAAPVQEGDVFEGKWRIESKLGQGGMGTVYLAQDLSLEREVAIKVLAGELCNDEEFVARFEREAKLTAHLDHPNVVLVYAVGKHRGRPFIVMKCLQGESLARHLRDFPQGMPLPSVLRIFRQLCAGLSYIHSKSFVHRDIKAGNVFIGPQERATILDFGILRDTRAGGNLTRAGVMMGTPHYMSPEQALARRTDHRADLYALGVLLFECLTGQLPLVGATNIATIQLHLHQPPPDPRDLVPSLPEGIGAVTARSMAKLASERFQSAEALLLELEAVLSAAEEAPEAIEPTRLTPRRQLRAAASQASSGPRAAPFRAAPPARATGPSLSDPRRSRIAAEPLPELELDEAAAQVAGADFEPPAQGSQESELASPFEPHPSPAHVQTAQVQRPDLRVRAPSESRPSHVEPLDKELPTKPPGGGAAKSLIAILVLAGISYGAWRVVTSPIDAPAPPPPSALQPPSVPPPRAAPVEEKPPTLTTAAKAGEDDRAPSDSKPGGRPAEARAAQSQKDDDKPEARKPALPAKAPPTPARPPRPALAPQSENEPAAAGFGTLRVATKLQGEAYWVTVFVDGEKRGETPLTLADLPAGLHEIKLVRPSIKPVSRTVVIKPGDVETLREELESL